MRARFSLAASFCVALLAVSPGAASAIPVTKRTETVPAGAGTVQEISVKCPKSRSFVSGGFSASDAAGQDGVGVVEGTWDGHRTWTITAARTASGAEAQQVTALVRCGRSAPKLSIASARSSERAVDGRIGARASCARGQTAVSGGFSQPIAGGGGIGPGRILTNMRIGERTWKVEADSPGVDTVRAEAYCLGRDSGTRFTSRTEFFGTADPLIATARSCGNESRAGGWRFESDGPETPLVFRSEPLGRGWSTASSVPALPDGTLTGYAYCP